LLTFLIHFTFFFLSFTFLILLIILEVEDAVLFALAQHHRSNVAGPADPGLLLSLVFLFVTYNARRIFFTKVLYVVKNQLINCSFSALMRRLWFGVSHMQISNHLGMKSSLKHSVMLSIYSINHRINRYMRMMLFQHLWAVASTYTMFVMLGNFNS